MISHELCVCVRACFLVFPCVFRSSDIYSSCFCSHIASEQHGFLAFDYGVCLELRGGLLLFVTHRSSTSDLNLPSIYTFCIYHNCFSNLLGVFTLSIFMFFLLVIHVKFSSTTCCYLFIHSLIKYFPWSI